MSINKIQFQKGLSIIEFIEIMEPMNSILVLYLICADPTVLHTLAVAAQNPASSLTVHYSKTI